MEQPWRSGRALFELRVRLASASPRSVAAAVALPVGVLSLILATAPGPNEPAILAEGATPAARRAPQPAPATGPAPTAGTVPRRGPVDSGTPRPWIRAHPAATTTTTTTTPPTTLAAPSPPTVPPSAEPILALGDSVLLAATPALSTLFGPQITIDAQVGRQVTAGLDRLAEYRSSGALARYHSVMIDLGTNGAFRPQDFQQLSQLVAGIPHVVVYDVHAARPWAATSNATIAAGVAAHPGQMQLADWDRAATPDLLYPDGIHPNTSGAEVYSKLLYTSLAAPAPAHP